MLVNRCIVTLLSLSVVLVSVLAACAAPTSTQTPTLTPASTPTGALAQVIAGAKKEGTVTAMLKGNMTPTSVERLRKEIKERFGVDLDIKFTPSLTYDAPLGQAIVEHQTGATPTYDIMTLADSFIPTGIRAGALEIVDWKPLITEDTSPGVILEDPAVRGAITYFTAIGSGLLYNPEKVPAAQLPQTLRDLADPKWNGKVGMLNYPTVWARWAFVLGKDKVSADLRAILKNKAIQGTYPNVYNRYLLGEIWMDFTNSSYLKMAQDKGMPAAWQHLDFAELVNHTLVLRTRAAHPNAAKLVAICLASPWGARLMLEEMGAGSLYYPGNFEHDLVLQAQRQGVPAYSVYSYPGLMEFLLADEYLQWQKDIDLVLKAG